MRKFVAAKCKQVSESNENLFQYLYTSSLNNRTCRQNRHNNGFEQFDQNQI